jgi:hypothetical protein
MTGRWRGDLTKPEDHLQLSHGLQARWYGEGLAFAVQIAAEAQGGRVEVDDKGLHVVAADSVTLRLAAATSFRGRNPEAACADALRAQRPYAERLARHVADHRSLFRSRIVWNVRERVHRPAKSLPWLDVRQLLAC